LDSTASADAPGQEAELKPPVTVKLFYSLGQVAQSGGFDTAIGFVFFYYTAVLGLSGALVGAALAISLAFDAIVDPLIGSWSDNIRSRLGRRLPLMILGAPLLCVTLGLLFSPPSGLSQGPLFIWLAVTSVAARSCISIFNVPYIALGAEMATGYVERSSVVAYRAIMGIVASVVVTALAFSLYFSGQDGLRKFGGYAGFGWTVALLMLVCTAVCCVGVARYAARLPQTTSVPTSMVRRLPGEVLEIFSNRSFRILFLSAVVFYVAVGLNATFGNHLNVFVWKLSGGAMQTLGYSYLGGILAGIPMAPLLSRWMEKRTMVLLGLGMVMVSWLLVPALRASGLWTESGDDAVLILALNLAFAGIGVGFCAIAYPSMMADAADEHENLFGRRREGLYFAGLGFAAKAASGVGVLVAGIALDLMRFPKEIALAAAPSEALLVKLILGAGPLAAMLAISAMVLFFPYALTRLRHDRIAEELLSRRMAERQSALKEGTLG